LVPAWDIAETFSLYQGTMWLNQSFHAISAVTQFLTTAKLLTGHKRGNEQGAVDKTHLFTRAELRETLVTGATREQDSAISLQVCVDYAGDGDEYSEVVLAHWWAFLLIMLEDPISNAKLQRVGWISLQQEGSWFEHTRMASSFQHAARMTEGSHDPWQGYGLLIAILIGRQSWKLVRRCALLFKSQLH
jgi:hypothetical protein